MQVFASKRRLRHEYTQTSVGMPSSPVKKKPDGNRTPRFPPPQDALLSRTSDGDSDRSTRLGELEYVSDAHSPLKEERCYTPSHPLCKRHKTMRHYTLKSLKTCNKITHILQISHQDYFCEGNTRKDVGVYGSYRFIGDSLKRGTYMRLQALGRRTRRLK